MQRSSSQRWLERAQAVTPGGVNSPVRAFRAVGGHPVFFVGGQGPYVTDVDGNTYVDLVGQWGPALLGHAHPAFTMHTYQHLLPGMSAAAADPYLSV